MVHRDDEGTSSSRVGSMDPNNAESGARHPGEAGILQQPQRCRRPPPAPTPSAGQRGCRRKVWIALTAGLVTFGTVHIVLPPSGWAVERAEAEETSRLLANLLKAGRSVVEHNQLLIDDPQKGDKGLTPEVFEQQLVQEFRKQTGLDLSKLQSTPASITLPPLAKELLPAFVLASKEVVRDAQVVINQLGLGYKNFIPATYGSKAAARFSI